MSDRAADKAAKAKAKEEAKLEKEKAKASKAADRDAKKIARLAELEASAKAREEEKARLLELAGDEFFEEYLGSKTIKFFTNGYVSVSMWGGGSPEKLVDLNVDTDISKKTGIGRAVVGVATFGVNIATTSNMRGDIYLSIVTDQRTHMIHVSPPSERDVKAALKIEATGNSLIKRSSQKATARKPTRAPSKDITKQLEQLVKLRDSGALTDSEFTKAKAKIIG